MFLLVRPLHVDVIVNASLSRIFFFNLAACSGEYSLFYVSCNRRLGGAIVEKLKIREELTLAIIDKSQAKKQKLKCTTGRNKLQINVDGHKYTALLM